MADRLTDNQTFDSPQAALAHYGVKGMKWGVRKDDKSSGGSRKSGKPPEPSVDDIGKVMDDFYSKKSSAELKMEGQKKLDAQAADPGFPSKRETKAASAREQAEEIGRQVADLKEQHSQTTPGIRGAFKRGSLNSQINDAQARQEAFEKRASQLEEGKLTDRQKAAIIGIGATAAIAGLAIYGSRQVDRQQASQLEANQRETNKQWNDLFGKDYGSTTAKGLTEQAGSGSFYAGLTSKKALSRPEFTIPEGTVFQRLSNHPEDTSEYGKVKGAYATFLRNDKKIYGASGEFGNKKYTISFEADGPVRVPNLTTVLAHLKQINKAEHPDTPSLWSDERVYSQYHQMAGGSWSDSVSTRLFDSLRTYGYSAIVDDMDAGYLGDLPVVFFGKAKPATVTERTMNDRGLDKAGILKLAREYA